MKYMPIFKTYIIKFNHPLDLNGKSIEVVAKDTSEAILIVLQDHPSAKGEVKEMKKAIKN